MLDKKSSNTRSAMVIGKGSTKGSTSEGKPSTKSSCCGEYYNKKEMDCLRALLDSTSKPLGSCALTMKVSKKQVIIVANGDHVSIFGSGNDLTMGRMIEVAKA
ncbi:hypothetical protein CR513_32735, partial [Mucuna pruriens]